MKFVTLLVPCLLAATAIAAPSKPSAPAKPAPSKPVAPGQAKAPARIAVAVTGRGFDPGSVTVPAKTPVTLVFTRTTEATCTKSVVLTLGDGSKIERALPLDKPVEIAVTFPKAGTLGYACSMNMNKGVIVVQ